MSNQKHACTTSFVFQFGFDKQKNAELLKYGRECNPEQIGVFNKEESEQAIIRELGIVPVFERHHFEIGRNENYSVYVSDMCRVTLKSLFGKEQAIAELRKKYNLTAVLSIVPYIVSDSEAPNQCLSLDADIIEFLCKSGTLIDLDYYIV